MSPVRTLFSPQPPQALAPRQDDWVSLRAVMHVELSLLLVSDSGASAQDSVSSDSGREVRGRPHPRAATPQCSRVVDRLGC
jgi:hypothetical protein